MATGAPLTRPAAFAAIAAVHAIGFATLGVSANAPTPALAATIAVHDVAVPIAPTVAPVIKLASIPADVSAPTVEIVDGEPRASGDCAVIDGLQSALARDPAVTMSLAALPVARSTTNAVSIWNERWVPTESDAVRAAVVARLKLMPSSCRAAVVTGPRLVIVATSTRPVVLAFGSGTWRWDDLLAGSATIGAV